MGCLHFNITVEHSIVYPLATWKNHRVIDRNTSSVNPLYFSSILFISLALITKWIVNTCQRCPWLNINLRHCNSSRLTVALTHVVPAFGFWMVKHQLACKSKSHMNNYLQPAKG